MEICNFGKKETVERYVTALYEPGAYNPESPEVKICMMCGFTMRDEATGFGSIDAFGKHVELRTAMWMRFCPICGSRFNREFEEGLYPQEQDPREEREVPQMESKGFSEQEYKELIGDDLFQHLVENGRWCGV